VLPARYDLVGDGRAIARFLEPAPIGLHEPAERLTGEIKLVGVQGLAADDFILARARVSDISGGVASRLVAMMAHSWREANALLRRARL
jgi:hypothetical protein